MGEIKCLFCRDTFTEADLQEFKEMGEKYYRDKDCFLCPDCWDAFSGLAPEDQIARIITLHEGGSNDGVSC